jgi:hypothetical protein
VVRFEGLPGEFSQHDFGHVDVTFVDGRKKRVHFFASRLKYSRFVAVSLVENERVETIVRNLARHFVAFGGLPLMAVFDRPRTIVKKSGIGRDVEQYNATFAQAIVDLGVGVEMCAPRSGNQKGTVERLVGWVKSSFFKHRKFQDDVDLLAQLAAWHVEVNTKTPSRATNLCAAARPLTAESPSMLADRARRARRSRRGRQVEGSLLRRDVDRGVRDPQRRARSRSPRGNGLRGGLPRLASGAHRGCDGARGSRRSQGVARCGVAGRLAEAPNR